MAVAAGLLGRAVGLGLVTATATGGRRLLRCGTGAGLRERGTGALLGGAVVCKAGGAADQRLSRGISSDQRPKRPLTAYLRFVMDNRPAFREKNPEASNLELIKKIAGAWKELPASQKQVYEEARKTDWKRYGEQMAAYKAQLTSAQAAALKEERRKQLEKRKSMRAKRELNLLGKPKRARSGFNIFLSENFQESEGASPVAKLKKLFDTWQKLSTSQKQPYLQLAEDDKVRYENEMKSWEAKMIELGREDLVRSKKQRLKKKPAETAKQAETKKKSSSGGNKAKLKKSEE
ncbi:PREDICTED: transcription factor A, mitochondrial [Pseudopodoces humilis]|uniref:transcription factor A, mitochondrial n=1 Tax=Pseudopodoces humilis TaxID=181119 RepID=UPI000395A4C9|nr:PREDICTED: transcription factor A, mitochondrial [Pseudopodoces humilis]